MGEKLIIGPINRGLRTDREPFIIDNDSFPTLINAYQWRGRVKRKRGTAVLARLQRIIGTTDGSGNITVTISPHPIQAGISVFQIGTDIFVDFDTNAAHDPIILLTNGVASTHTLNRTTGVLTIVGSQINTSVIYFPALPVMGIEDFIDSTQAYPGNVSFDTTYAYSISTTNPYTPTDVSFYKNPLTGTYSSYVAKGSPTPLWWNGADYQQFWTTNYQGALWATNGIDIPFTGATIGMQFAPAATITYVSNTATTISVTITGSPLIVGDFVFFNEWTATTPADAATLNFQTGYVTTAAAPNYTITLPNATLAASTYVPGIIQYLTNRSDNTVDNIRFYDGTGWVNFMPPLSQGLYVIDDAPQAIYYLVGARLILPFKDRLLFFGPVIQTSTNPPIYLQDTVIYSQNGTPFYTASFTGNPLATNTVFNAILVPTNQTATPTSYWEDQFGFGGFQAAGIDQAITTVSPNEDALITGFNQSIETRLVYTGNDIQPFAFFIINAELGSSSTFSAVTMDEGVISRGPRGFIITSQTSCARIDLDVLDQVFEVSNLNNGAERFCAQRDFINEWIYFTYPISSSSQEISLNVFPNQTLLYNYRDQSWAIFNECYTTYGTFRRLTGETWATIGNIYPTWNDWNAPWNSGESDLLEPIVAAGNQQGYVILRDTDSTGEAPSLYINNISSSTVTSVNHCLNLGDYIVINGALGTVGNLINGKVFSVTPVDNNTFTIYNPLVIVTGTYLGGGTITRMYIPQIYSKQFPVAWELGRKTRIGVQQYLFTKTPVSQVTLLLFLSTDISTPYNNSSIVPDPLSINNGLIYSTVLYTCPESTNLGLTPFNTNLQNLTAIDSMGSSSNSQQQIWHRMNTSLIGDTVQFGFTLNDAQMRDVNLLNQFAEIEFHAAILDLNPSGMLS
jgi:hypothetical protein